MKGSPRHGRATGVMLTRRDAIAVERMLRLYHLSDRFDNPVTAAQFKMALDEALPRLSAKVAAIVVR